MKQKIQNTAIHKIGAQPKEISMDKMDQVYYERNIAFLGMMKTFQKTDLHTPMGWYDDNSTTSDWIVVWCNIPTGEISRHIPRSLIKDIGWLENQPDNFDQNPYSTEENNERLKSFIEGE